MIYPLLVEFEKNFLKSLPRYDAIIIENANKSRDVDCLSTSSSTTPSAASLPRKTRGRPTKQINFDCLNEDSTSSLSQQIAAMANSEELPSLDEEWAVIKRATVQGTLFATTFVTLKFKAEVRSCEFLFLDASLCFLQNAEFFCSEITSRNGSSVCPFDH